ncbi:MAG TPA: hypothetical protein VJ323_13475, partial [Bryobacteraceae bacterium]|nr:hypothetical protein [Bryobacteraceae bacterium]
LPGPRLKREGDRWTWNYDLPQSIGRVRSFYGNFGVLVRALAYIMAHGGNGLRKATLDALLNANYLRKKLEAHYEMAYASPTMHECVFSDDRQARKGVRTGDIAKRLIDYGFHPYTVSFPLIVRGALMIEPTETESKQELDLFAEAMISIAQEIEDNPDLVLQAPHSTRTSRVDEVTAARRPILRWKPSVEPAQTETEPGASRIGLRVGAPDVSHSTRSIARSTSPTSMASIDVPQTTVTFSPRGAHTRGSLAPKSAIVGTPIAAARCVGPESLPMNRFAPAMNLASESRLSNRCACGSSSSGPAVHATGSFSRRANSSNR